MSYITAAALMALMGTRELNTLITGKLDLMVDDELLAVVIGGGDVGTFQTKNVAQAQQALTFIEQTIISMSNLMNGYLAERYALPLAPQVIEHSGLPLICSKLTKYELMLSADEQAKNDKQDAMAQLRDIAKGLITLGGNSAQAVTTSSHSRVCRPHGKSLTDGFGR